MHCASASPPLLFIHAPIPPSPPVQGIHRQPPTGQLPNEPHLAAAAAAGAASRVQQGQQGLPRHPEEAGLVVAALLVLHQLLRVLVVQRQPGGAAEAEAAAARDHLHALAQGDPHQPARLHVHRAEAHRPRPRPRRRAQQRGGRLGGAGRVVVLLVRELRPRPRGGPAPDAAAAADGRAIPGGAGHPAVHAGPLGAAALRAPGALRPVPAHGRRRASRPAGDVGEHHERRARVLAVHGGGDANVPGLLIRKDARMELITSRIHARIWR